jgi:hypothetical protein
METRYDLLRAFVESPIFKRRNDDSDWMLRTDPLHGVDTRVTMAILSKGSTPESIKIHMLVDICGAVKVMKTVVIDTTDDITSVYILDSRYQSFDRELIDVVRKWLNQAPEDDMIYDESFLSLIDGDSGYKYLRLVAWAGASVFAGFCVFCTWLKVSEFFAGL